MAIAKQEILDAIASMTVLELSQLIKDMEEKFGVSAAAAPSRLPRPRPAARSPPRPRRRPSSPSCSPPPARTR